MSHLIEIRDLRKTYDVGDEPVHALDGVSTTIDSGEFVAIMGASGSGKSTMLNILGCLDVPTSGRYYVEGIDTAAFDEDMLSRILLNLISNALRFTPAGGRVRVGWRAMGDPFLGDEKQTSFNTQGSYVFKTVPGQYIFMCERHNTADFERCSYIWLPIHFLSNGGIEVRYKNTVDIDA